MKPSEGATRRGKLSAPRISIRPTLVRQTKCQKLGKFLYDKKRKTTCNRSCKNWGFFVFHYIFFVMILIGLFLAMFVGFTMQIQRTKISGPMSSKEKFSLPGQPPAISLLPTTAFPYPEPIIWYVNSGKDSENNVRPTNYVKAIETFLNAQENYCRKFKNDRGDCPFKRNLLGPCGETDFGYSKLKPCIYLKLNFKEGWGPFDMRSTPGHMQPITVWTSCEGETPYDKEKLGNIKYYPAKSFAEDYFPLVKGFRINPVIAVHLENIEPGFIVNLKCYIYGKSIPKGTEANAYIYVNK